MEKMVGRELMGKKGKEGSVTIRIRVTAILRGGGCGGGLFW